MMRVSIICVYNNSQSLNNQLIKSLKNFEKINYELVLVDSVKLGFSCSADALNYGASIAKGDVLIFAHQDIYVKNEEELIQFCQYIYDEEIGSIVGAAGAIEGDKINYTNYTTGTELNNSINDTCKNICDVASVDESFFGMRKETYDNHCFDSNLCDNWHLYAVEASLYARKNKKKVQVFPIQIHHYSNGTISVKYMKGLLKIADAYKDTFKYIWTTCYKIKSNVLYTRILFCLWCIHRKLIGKEL